MERLAARTGLPVTLLGALATVYVVWGSTYLGIKVALEGFPPMLLGAFRFLAAGAVLYAWTGRRRDLPRAGARQWLAAAVTGGLMLVGGNGAVTWAEQRIDSGVAALLVATVPLWMAVLARVWQSERLRGTAVVGLLVGFAGVGVLVRPSGDNVALLPSLAVLAGALSWALGSIYVRSAPLPSHALRSTSMQMLAGGALFGVIGLATGEAARLDLAGVTWRSAGALVYLAVFGSIIAFSAYTWLLRNAKPSIVSTYAYVNPFVAVLLGAVLLAEPVTSGMAVAAGLIIVGVALIVTPARGRRAARVAQAPRGTIPNTTARPSTERAA
ncbi:MAG TPA: EamA family transporter [Egibacteraceae bacterium]|nr:EamA family transporter [Egibacteraceae bacterium]